jgi:hypothetical protein
MKVRADASKKRATIRWNLSLELVTTGMAKTSPIKPLLNFLDCGTGAGLFCSQKRKILEHALICHHYFPAAGCLVVESTKSKNANNLPHQSSFREAGGRRLASFEGIYTKAIPTSHGLIRT